MRRYLTVLICLICLAPVLTAQEAEIEIDDLQRVIEASDSARRPALLPRYELRPAVFDRIYLLDTLKINSPRPSDSLFESETFNWLDDAVFNASLMRKIRQDYMVANPLSVRYNERLLPEPPRRFRVELDPTSAKLVFVEDSVTKLVPVTELMPETILPETERRHWIRNANALLQFSQAYISPNWYQGGSNNLTMLLDLGYGVKLNPKFHPKLLCEMSVSYRLSVHGTPEDSLRNYNISQDLFQFNGKVGYKAWRNWFYSLTGTFKTQFFNNYEINHPELRSAFLSPSELNMGLGMTWDHQNARKTLTVNASISPLSWNMKTCINHRLDPEDFGIRPGHRVRHGFGSSAEVKLKWQLTYNISYTSRLFAFTDFSVAQGDWENTFSFDINRFLSTQLFVHVRYDSDTPRWKPDARWHVWQLKEILSFGFSYKFSMK